MEDFHDSLYLVRPEPQEIEQLPVSSPCSGLVSITSSCPGSLGVPCIRPRHRFWAFSEIFPSAGSAAAVLAADKYVRVFDWQQTWETFLGQDAMEASNVR
jgi:hypothetical protein